MPVSACSEAARGAEAALEAVAAAAAAVQRESEERVDEARPLALQEGPSAVYPHLIRDGEVSIEGGVERAGGSGVLLP